MAPPPWAIAPPFLAIIRLWTLYWLLLTGEMVLRELAPKTTGPRAAFGGELGDLRADLTGLEVASGLFLPFDLVLLPGVGHSPSSSSSSPSAKYTN